MTGPTPETRRPRKFLPSGAFRWLRGLDLNQRPLGYELLRSPKSPANLHVRELQRAAETCTRRNPAATNSGGGKYVSAVRVPPVLHGSRPTPEARRHPKRPGMAPHCGDRLRLIATLHDPSVIRKILGHLGTIFSRPLPGPAPPMRDVAAP